MGSEGGYLTQDASVVLKQVVSVYPLPSQSKHGGDSILSLSNLDRKCPMLMYTVFFYRPTEELMLAAVFQTLKTALEKTLAVWYPAAGRLKINKSDGKFDLLCNDAGAVMAEASTDFRFSGFGDISQYNPFF